MAFVYGHGILDQANRALLLLCGDSFGMLLHEVVSGQRPEGKRATEDLRHAMLFLQNVAMAPVMRSSFVETWLIWH